MYQFSPSLQHFRSILKKLEPLQIIYCGYLSTTGKTSPFISRKKEIFPTISIHYWGKWGEGYKLESLKMRQCRVKPEIITHSDPKYIYGGDFHHTGFSSLNYQLWYFENWKTHFFGHFLKNIWKQLYARKSLRTTFFPVIDVCVTRGWIKATAYPMQLWLACGSKKIFSIFLLKLEGALFCRTKKNIPSIFK